MLGYSPRGERSNNAFKSGCFIGNQKKKRKKTGGPAREKDGKGIILEIHVKKLDWMSMNTGGVKPSC